MSSISTTNPYLNHSQLSPLEADVLWEYAKLGDKIRRIAQLARVTAENPNEELLANLRDLEKKMKVVLTLFRTSVWMILQDQEVQAEQAEQEQAAADDQEQEEYDSRRADAGAGQGLGLGQGLGQEGYGYDQWVGEGHSSEY